MQLRRWLAWILFVPTLAWNMLLNRVLGVRHWWDPVDEQVLLGALPLRRDVPVLVREGVGAVVNTCAEYAGPLEAYRQAGIEQLRIPTIDFTPPTLAAVETAVQFMQDQIAQGRRVYVHCKAGRARSATVVLCWLIAARHLTPDAAQQRILQCRPHAHPHLTDRAVVQQFWAHHQAASTDSTMSGPLSDETTA